MTRLITLVCRHQNDPAEKVSLSIVFLFPFYDHNFFSISSEWAACFSHSLPLLVMPLLLCRLKHPQQAESQATPCIHVSCVYWGIKFGRHRGLAFSFKGELRLKDLVHSSLLSPKFSFLKTVRRGDSEGHFYTAHLIAQGINLKTLSLEEEVQFLQSKSFQPDPGDVLSPNNAELRALLSEQQQLQELTVNRIFKPQPGALLSDLWLVGENKTPLTMNLWILEIQEQPCNLYGITTFLFIGIGRRLLSPKESLLLRHQSPLCFPCVID